MKLYFDNIFGHQTDGDLLFSVVSAEFDQNEWNYAFENGWSPIGIWYNRHKNILWYQSRQTRIDTKVHSHSRKTKLLLQRTPVSWVVESSHGYDEEIYSLYVDYCKYKKLTDIATYDEIDIIFNYPVDQRFIKFYYEDKLIGITKMSTWMNSVYSEFFWWNYKNPKLSVGKLSGAIEIDIAKQSGNRYLYTGLGYHHHGIYKSLKKGFEWWTGREWSKDIPLYVHLCNKDDEIKTIDELHQHQLDYFEENDV